MPISACPCWPSASPLPPAHFQILDDHTNDLTETKRDNRKIIAVQTQCRNADKHIRTHNATTSADERDQ